MRVPDPRSSEGGSPEGDPPPGKASSEEPTDDVRARHCHDLRTMLHQIIGCSELLLERAQERGDEATLADLARIGGAARRALDLADAVAPRADTTPPWGVLFQGPGPLPPVSAPRAPSPPIDRAQVRLLVVDDDELNRDMLSRRLGARGFQVTASADGEDARRRLEAEACDLVLLDVMMPEVSGIDVLRWVRERWAESDLPVIMAAARDATEDVVEALSLGANDYVTKPLDFPVVLARIETQLTLKQQKKEIRRLAEDLALRNRFIRSLFDRYVSEEVVSNLLDSPEGPKLGGESRRVTLLMSDVRGFTPMTEGLSPELVLRLLNSYLAAMADVIVAHQGTINEFVGDGILAIFGAPLSRPDDARRAVACAAAMQTALVELNEKNALEGLPWIDMGVALHTGEVIVGNIGSERRTKYGVVGSAVNHAGRIESFTVGGQVLLSEATLREAGEGIRVGSRLAIDAKGTREPIVVYDLRGVGEQRLPDAAEEGIALAEPMRALCHVVVGKRVEAEAFGARVIELSPHGAIVISPRRLRALSNLKIQLQPDGREPIELYAKVVAVAADGAVSARFTSLPADVDRWLRRVVAEARQRGE